MKVLSLLQPWASLVALGHKRFETRSWEAIDYRGDLAIHASAGWAPACRTIAHRPPFLELLRDRMPHDFKGNLDPPRGVILAVVDLVDCIPTEEAEIHALAGDRAGPLRGVQPARHEHAFGDYSPGRFAWLLRNARPLARPIPAKGRRLLWDWSTAEIRAAL